MTARADALDWTKSEEPLRMRLDGSTDFSELSDEQLVEEWDGQRRQLDELVVGPDSSPAVEQIRLSIERELGDLAIELVRRGLSDPPRRRRGGRQRIRG